MMETFCRHLDAMPEAIAFLSPRGRLLYGNRLMHALLNRRGLRADDPALLATLVSSGESDRLADEAEALFTGDAPAGPFEAIVSESAANEPDARTHSLLLRRAAEPDGEAAAGCVMLTMRDITDLIHGRDEAERANHAKSVFISRVSHEIRTPLNAIIGTTQVARRADSPEKMQKCVSQIESSSRHLLGIINDVLDLSKIEAGKMALTEEAASLPDSIRFVLSMMESQARQKRIAIAPEMRLTHETVLVDTLRLNQVLMNLLSNAVKFSPEGTVIRIALRELEPDGAWMVYQFSVIDQGIGMTREQIGRLFQSFEQADSSITRRFGGTGLGLAISRNIVEMMRGRVWVESEVNVGSAFHFIVRLKAAPRAVAAPVDRLADSRSLLARSSGTKIAITGDRVDFSALRILIVDDIEVNRAIVSELLTETGARMEEATNGREVVDMFQNSPPGYYDVILMDIQMPVLDGYAATREIRAMNRDDSRRTAIIAMTANVMKEDVELSLRTGMDGHVSKPIHIDTVIETIIRTLAAAG